MLTIHTSVASTLIIFNVNIVSGVPSKCAGKNALSICEHFARPGAMGVGGPADK